MEDSRGCCATAAAAADKWRRAKRKRRRKKSAPRERKLKIATETGRSHLDQFALRLAPMSRVADAHATGSPQLTPTRARSELLGALAVTLLLALALHLKQSDASPLIDFDGK